MISKANKKMLAIVTAFMFMFTVFAPVGLVGEAEAASKNRVDRVVYVDKDEDFNALPRVPYLIIQDEDGDFSNGERFRLQLPGSAEWNLATGTDTATTTAAVASDGIHVTSGTVNYTIRAISDQVVDVTFNSGDISGNTFHIPLNVDLDNASGEIKVTINPMDSALSSGSFTFAVVEAGGTIATVSDKEDVTRGPAREGATITLDETRIGALSGEQVFRLRLPSGFEWVTTGSGTVTEANAYNFGNGSVEPDVTIHTTNNTRTIELRVNVAAPSEVSRGYITIDPVFNVTRDANMGDVKVDLLSTRGDITAISGLVIAEYLEHGVTISIDEAREFLAGRASVENLGNLDEEEYTTATITIEQTGSNALLNGRIVEFELPSWVKVAAEDDATNEQIFNAIFDSNGQTVFNNFWINSDRNKFEVNVNTPNTNDIELELPLIIEADKTGDIHLNVKGAGLNEQNLLVGKALAPVQVDIKVADVRLGVQQQSAPDIVITENEAGALMERGYLVVNFRDHNGLRFDNADFVVTAGDLEIDVDASSVQNERLLIYIDTESTVPSTIKVTNIELTVNRMAPEGPVRVDVGGNALIGYVSEENGVFTNNESDFNGRVLRTVFANVITPAPGEVRATASFSIGSTSYTVDGVEKQMDAMPYIKNDRTFLPLRYVAEALGVNENNIMWNQSSQTATIIKGDRVVSVQIGNYAMTVNGTTLYMDVAPEITGDRTYLPLRFIGQALGANLEWVAETQTAIVKQ
ncbi:copper amine oxidase N-terminal domain-containing protein [Heliorestis convoluta]|uniref:Copper amine oxidase N-terminal domain-containing protein n=1 Tax=Heliorestis convoluta TaxID=356322 RepID=A0A5Q2N087_9FIRM|nr:copper amine oxidase N-terminal domain-containing protein [Heliorestis convoluta]QGG47189.1 copper amine oxidase N-terminal domain-containing protein [Heliorestis convoluta]